MSKDKESICVTVRVRPLSSKQLEEDSRTCLRVDETLNMISITGPNSEKEAKDFYFDSVCDANQQNQMFQRVGKRSTVYCMEGYNCTIFAYGQTGAGKTYTMMGVNPQSRDFFQQRGLIPRTLQHLFECIQKQISEAGVDYIIKCSFVEIYNQQIIDLLGNGSSALNIREDLKKGVYIEGVSEQIISQSQQAMQILRKGSKGRHVGSTCYNETSSRSHSVFTMQIQSQQLSNGIKSTKSRHFHFIDLAGSERTKKSMGDRLKQGCSINKSLHVLSMVISSLAEVSEGKTRHVNYRDSKLTFLLKDSLGGNSKTHLIANVSPSLISSLQTKSTLMFARKVKLIKVNKVSINQDASGNLQSLKAEIRRLRSENILLRNGNVSIPTSLAIQQSQGTVINNSNSKMVNALQQYVDQQLEKQTQMQMQISKLQNRNNHLQKGIKHFSQNQKQLRMVIAIYEDKINKLKKTQALLFSKLEYMSQSQKIQEIRQYFMSQRKILIEEIEKFKQLSSSSMLVKNLLRQLKVLKQNPESTKQEQSLIQVLTKNNTFLQQLKKSIIELEPEVQQGKASKALIKQNEELKSQNINLNEKLQKYTLQLTETKDKTEETQNLLNEAISNQINLQKKLEQQQNLYNQQMEDNKQIVSLLRQQLSETQQKVKFYISKQNQLNLNISKYQLEISQLKAEIKIIKQKKQFDQLNFQQKLEALTTENTKMQQILKRKAEQIQKLKSDSLQMKTQSQRINKQTQMILVDAALRIQQLEQLSGRLETEKSDLRQKMQQQQTNYEQKIKILNQQKQQSHMKMKQLANQLKNYQQQILKHQQQIVVLQQKNEQIQRTHLQQKHKWEENNNQLIKMINQKKACDSETQAKLTQSQLQIISLNQKLTEITIQQKTSQQNYKSLQSTTQGKLQDLQQLNREKDHMIEQLTSQSQQMKSKIQVLTQIQHSLKRQQKAFEQQIAYKQEQQFKLTDDIQKLKKKQKQVRIMLNQSKNEMYAIKKNYEIEIQSIKQQLRMKQDSLISLIAENNNIKQTHQKYLADYKRKTEAQLQILKQNEGSIKKAMEAHLLNKQKKIIQIKTLNQNLQQSLREKTLALNEINQNVQKKSQQIADITKKLKTVQEQSENLKTNLKQLQSSMSQLESGHLKAVQQMENNFNDEIDSKNAEIQSLRRQDQQKQIILHRLSGVQDENNQLKSQLINNQAFCEQLQQMKLGLMRDLQAIRNNGQQANNYVIQLEGQLKQKQIYLNQLNQNIKIMQQTFTTQAEQKEKQIKSLGSNLQSTKIELQNLNKLNQKISKEKQQQQQTIRDLQNRITIENKQKQNLARVVKSLENDKLGMNQHIMMKKKQNYQLNEHKMQIQRIVQRLVQNQRQIFAYLSQFMTPQEINSGQQIHFITKIQQILNEIQLRNKSLQAAVEQKDYANQNIVQQNQKFLHIIRELEAEIQMRNIESSQHIDNISRQLHEVGQRNFALTQQFKQMSDMNMNLQKELNQLTVALQRKHKQNQNLQQHLLTTKRKAESEQNMLNQRLAKTHEQSTIEVRRLNDLYEVSKQKLESLKIQNDKLYENQIQLKKLHQNKIYQLENNLKVKSEDLNRLDYELASEREKSQQLQKYIDEQGYKINNLQQQKQRLNEQVSQIKMDTQKRLKESQKRCQLGAAQMNGLRQQIKLIQDEASVWKQRMENLQNQIRLSNERAQKFRSQYIKQKQLNKQFKMLLDNAHCQIQTFKAQVMDKDKLYHQLLQKVSKNDIQRKGLLTNDKKFSDLLEKSRIQLNQTRKKYDDQLKINNILKQQLEKKDVDVSIVKQRSEQYCRKQHQLMQSIRSDYSKVEAELKSTQNMLVKSKQSLKKVTQKNEELQQQIQNLNKNFVDVSLTNQELKKQSLKTGIDQKQISYVNKLKEQNTQLKRQLQKVSEEVIAVNQEKLRLKAEMRHGKDPQTSNLELSKKISQVKYLQKIIDDSINVLGIRDYKRSVGQSLKSGIMELQKQLTKSKSDLVQLADEINTKNQKIQILQNQKFKTNSSKEQQDTLAKMRNKINRASSTFQSIRQSKQQDKLILQMKDTNKSNLWGMNNRS